MFLNQPDIMLNIENCIQVYLRIPKKPATFIIKEKQEDYIHFLSNCEIFLEEKVHVDIKIASLNAPCHSSNYLHRKLHRDIDYKLLKLLWHTNHTMGKHIHLKNI